MKVFNLLIIVALLNVSYGQTNEVARGIGSLVSEWGDTTTCEDWELDEAVQSDYSFLVDPFQSVELDCYSIYLPKEDFQPYVNTKVIEFLNYGVIEDIQWSLDDNNNLYCILMAGGKVENALHFYNGGNATGPSYLTVYTWVTD